MNTLHPPSLLLLSKNSCKLEVPGIVAVEDICRLTEQNDQGKGIGMDSIISALTVSKTPLIASNFPLELSETLAAYNSYLSVSSLSSSASPASSAEAYFAVPSAFLKVFRGAEGQVSLLYALGRQAYRLCLLSPNAASSEECARLLLRLLTACITEKQERVCKRAGAYLMASLLLRCYFHGVKQTSLIGNVVRVLGQCEIPSVEWFPKAHVCMYKYYLSRYLIGKGQLQEALSELEWIYVRIVQKSSEPVFERNLERIMVLMVPLKLLLQQKWPQRHRTELIKALWNGNLTKYALLMKANRSILLKQGTFIIYQQLNLLAFQQLLKRLQCELNGSTRIPLKLIGACAGDESGALSWLVEVIAKGAVKGYLSEEHGYLVLSAQNPFPSLG